MSNTGSSDLVARAKDDAEDFVRQRHGVVSGEEIVDAATKHAESLVPLPRMTDMLLWRIMVGLSVVGPVLVGVIFSFSVRVREESIVPTLMCFVFLTMLGVAYLVAVIPREKRRSRATALREELHTAWTLAANQSVTAHQLSAEQEAEIAAQEARIAEQQAEREAEREAERQRLQTLLSRPAPPPDPQAYGVSPEGAERIVEAWMRHLGALDAEVTRYSGDGGIDVVSSGCIAQVKHHQGIIGVAPVRELAGVASVDGRQALFFTSTGYAPGAVGFADRAEIALFTYSVEEGTLAAVNMIAAELYDRGLAH